MSSLEKLDEEWKALNILGGPGTEEFNMGWAWYGARNRKEFPDQIKVLQFIIEKGKKFCRARSKEAKSRVVSETWQVLNASIEAKA